MLCMYISIYIHTLLCIQYINHCRLWPTEPRPERLYNAEFSPPTTDITVERDPMLGKLLGFHEVYTYTDSIVTLYILYTSLSTYAIKTRD